MQSNLKGRNFICDLDFSKEEIDTILDVAFDLKMKRAMGVPTPYLREKILAERFADVTLDMGLTDGYNTPCAAENRHKKQHMAA